MTYREFNIEHNGWAYIYSHKEYDGPEDRRIGSAFTIEEAKQEIDDYIAANTTYFVNNPVAGTITKFFFIQEAINFCKSIGLDQSFITFWLDGEEVSFDSI